MSLEFHHAAPTVEEEAFLTQPVLPGALAPLLCTSSHRVKILLFFYYILAGGWGGVVLFVVEPPAAVVTKLTAAAGWNDIFEVSQASRNWEI